MKKNTTPTGPLNAKTLTLIALITLSGLMPAMAQTQFAGWMGSFQNYKINEKLGIFFDAQVRSTGQWEHVQAVLIRPGINFYLTPRITATAGYAYIPHRKTAGHHSGILPEHRTWQQVIYQHPVSLSHNSRPTTVQHRLRLEQRYLPKPVVEDNSLKNDGFTNANRIRYFARGVIPLTGNTASASGKPAFTEGFFASLQNELFFNLGDASAVNGKFFDQNRAYVSFGYRFSKQFDTEIGYMNQYIVGTGDNTTNNHILQVATYVRL